MDTATAGRSEPDRWSWTSLIAMDMAGGLVLVLSPTALVVLLVAVDAQRP